MKKVICSFIAICVFGIMGTQEAKAQNWVLGGDATAFYVKSLDLNASVLGGYELNDKVAFGASLGAGSVITGKEDVIEGLAGMYIRFTPLSKDRVFLDLVYRADMHLYNGLSDVYLAMSPAVRFRATPKIDVYTYFGALGACCENGNWSPRIGISSQQAAVGIVYRFL